MCKQRKWVLFLYVYVPRCSLDHQARWLQHLGMTTNGKTLKSPSVKRLESYACFLGLPATYNFMQLEGKVGQIKRKNRFLSRLLPLLFSLVYTDASTIFRPAFNILFELNFAAKLHRTQSVAWSSSTWHGVWKPELHNFISKAQILTCKTRLIVFDAISRYFRPQF